MAALTVQQAAQTGIVVAFVAAAGGGDSFVNDGRTYLHVKNGGGGSINVTVDSVRACDQGGDHDVVVAVGAGAEKVIGPLDPVRFNGAGGAVAVSYSAVTTVTVAAVKL